MRSPIGRTPITASCVTGSRASLVLDSGVGVGLCTGCHGDGFDYVLTPFPLQ